MAKVKTHTKVVDPPASALVESLRDIGYSLPTAVSDIIDNSIAARATHIEWMAYPHGDEPFVGFLDNGWGMTADELLEAMRLGGTRSLAAREDFDLGRFGLGLKTASFSQCRQLTVLTRKDGVTSCARWDLDLIEKTGKWTLEFLSDFGDVPMAERLTEEGTLVVWRKLDRLVEMGDDDNRDRFIRELDEAATYVELVFHRFMAGEVRGEKLHIVFNGRELDPFDPFHSKHPATQRDPEEPFKLAGQKIQIQPFTLPHHKKVTPSEWEKYAMTEGYVKNQGFYVYRQGRLIIYGTWFSLRRQDEITKLSRIRIDIPSELDSHWKIDIKKASVQLPDALRKHLKNLVEKMVMSPKRVYEGRGAREATKERIPVWQRIHREAGVHYSVNEDHPFIKEFICALSGEQSKLFSQVIKLINSNFPIDSFFYDVANDPNFVNNEEYTEEQLEELVRITYGSLKEGGANANNIRGILLSSEPFKSNEAPVVEAINRIAKEESHV